MTYLVGIDSGGTRTNIRIVPLGGDPIDLPELDTVIDPVRGEKTVEEAFREIHIAIEAQLFGAPRSTWISAAGYAAGTKDTIERYLNDYLSVPGYLGIANDAVSLAMAHEAYTVIAIVGTGSVVMARSSDDAMIQLGGNGWVATDYGSGFWIGLEGIRAAYRAFERRGEQGQQLTGLTTRLVSHYRKLAAKSEKIEQAIPVLVRELNILGYDLKHQVASFANVVCDLAQRSDMVAQEIVRGAAEEVADLIAKMYLQLINVEHGIVPKVLLCGSVANLSQFFRNALSNRLNLNLSAVLQDLGQERIEVTTLPSGVDDAVALARRMVEGGSSGFPRLDSLHPVRIYEVQ